MLSVRSMLLGITLLLAMPLPAADSRLFLGQIQLEDARATQSDAGPLQYWIQHENAPLLQAQLGHWLDQLHIVDGGVAFSLDAYPTASNVSVTEQHRAASFLIDYDEPVLQALRVPIEQHYGKQPTPEQLEQFVYDYIVNKNSAHGFDVASRVAKSRAGDCTEHAVLLTALLRLYGYPARTITGVYVSLQQSALAYGHAWTEYHSATGWSGLDATGISERVGAQHIPLGVVENETIAYAMGLLSSLQALAIERIRVR